MAVRTRFAPSPTGYLHVGGARTALFCWLYARRHGGRFILRIEDTDRERSTQGAVEGILDGLRWLGLDWDEGPCYQTERMERYREAVESLLASGSAYRCYCSKERLDRIRAEQLARREKPRYDGHCRGRDEDRAPPGAEPPVIRFRTPRDGETVIDDLVRGRVVIRNDELDDLVIVRADGTPTYNFSVVVDDLDMAVTHVIRGDDHVNNTPRQIHILRALGGEVPAYAHVPMILGRDGQRLSKRHGAVSVTTFRDDGYLPEAMLNHLARLGWSHGDQEIFSREELVELFDIRDVNRGAALVRHREARLAEPPLRQGERSEAAGGASWKTTSRASGSRPGEVDPRPRPDRGRGGATGAGRHVAGDGEGERLLLPRLRRLRARRGPQASASGRVHPRSRSCGPCSRTSLRGTRPASRTRWTRWPPTQGLDSASWGSPCGWR